jgi:hypothetical protein
MVSADIAHHFNRGMMLEQQVHVHCDTPCVLENGG